MEFERPLPFDRIPPSEYLRDLPKVGVIGMPGSGKGTVGGALSYLNFEHVVASSEIRGVLAREGYTEPFSREELVAAGKALRGESDALGEQFKHLSQTTIVDMMLRRAVLSYNNSTSHSDISKGLIFDGLRGEADAGSFKSLSNSFLIALSTDPQIRFERNMARGRTSGDNSTYEGFLKSDMWEQELFESGLPFADIVVENDSCDLSEFQSEIIEIVRARFQL